MQKLQNAQRGSPAIHRDPSVVQTVQTMDYNQVHPLSVPLSVVGEWGSPWSPKEESPEFSNTVFRWVNRLDSQKQPRVLSELGEDENLSKLNQIWGIYQEDNGRKDNNWTTLCSTAHSLIANIRSTSGLLGSYWEMSMSFPSYSCWPWPSQPPNVCPALLNQSKGSSRSSIPLCLQCNLKAKGR